MANGFADQIIQGAQKSVENLTPVDDFRQGQIDAQKVQQNRQLIEGNKIKLAGKKRSMFLDKITKANENLPPKAFESFVKNRLPSLANNLGLPEPSETFRSSILDRSDPEKRKTFFNKMSEARRALQEGNIEQAQAIIKDVDDAMVGKLETLSESFADTQQRSFEARKQTESSIRELLTEQAQQRREQQIDASQNLVQNEKELNEQLTKFSGDLSDNLNKARSAKSLFKLAKETGSSAAFNQGVQNLVTITQNRVSDQDFNNFATRFFGLESFQDFLTKFSGNVPKDLTDELIKTTELMAQSERKAGQEQFNILKQRAGIIAQDPTINKKPEEILSSAGADTVQRILSNNVNKELPMASQTEDSVTFPGSNFSVTRAISKYARADDKTREFLIDSIEKESQFSRQKIEEVLRQGLLRTRSAKQEQRNGGKSASTKSQGNGS